MPEVAIVLNVNSEKYDYPRGILGTYTVPAATEEGFGLLVVYSRGEVQDVGNGNRKVNEMIPARLLAQDILGYGGERMEKRGLLICEAEPDETKDIEKAVRAEKDYLNAHPPDIRQRMNQTLKVREVVNMQDMEPGAREEKIKLSDAVQKARAKFEAYCRSLVTKAEVEKAKKNLEREDQRLVAEGDTLWSQEVNRKEVTAKHQDAAKRLGQERPWVYMPSAMEDCEACGRKVKKGVAICGHCGALLNEAAARKFFPGGLPGRGPWTTTTESEAGLGTKAGRSAAR